jgi:hypothetical protein
MLITSFAIAPLLQCCFLCLKKDNGSISTTQFPPGEKTLGERKSFGERKAFALGQEIGQRV